MNQSDRSFFEFAKATKEKFVFLEQLGFSIVEELLTLVRYRKDGVEVDIYHSRRSYEIGAGVTVFDARYSIS